MAKRKLTYFIINAGIGGFSLSAPKTTCVGVTESDYYCNAILKYHFPDIRKYNEEKEIPTFDLLVGRIPYEVFKDTSRGFYDAGGGFFLKFRELLCNKRPRYFLLTGNKIKSILSREYCSFLITFIEDVTSLGFTVEWQVLNSRSFGIPQNSEKLYIIGHLGRRPAKPIFPLTIPRSKYKRGHEETIVALTSKLTKEGKRLKQEKGADLYKEKYLAMRKDNIANAIISYPSEEQMLYNKETERIRFLTPIEYERLQGFPDNWTRVGIGEQGGWISIPNKNRYSMIAEDVNVTVMSRVMKGLLK